MIRRVLLIIVCWAATAAAQVSEPSTNLPGLTARSCVNERQLKATPSSLTETSVRFINRRGMAIRLYSLDAVGLRHVVVTLQPGMDTMQSTSTGTPWIVTDLQDQCVAVFLPSQQAAQAVIADSAIPIPGTGTGTGVGVPRPVFFPGVPSPGGDVVAPQVLQQVKPRYTAAAIGAHLQGSVWLAAVVLRDGTVGETKVVRSLDTTYGLDDEAVKCAKQWRFRRGTRNGEPIPVSVIIQLDFTLRPPGAE